VSATSTTFVPLPVPLCIHCGQHDARVTHICSPIGSSTTKWIITDISIASAPHRAAAPSSTEEQ